MSVAETLHPNGVNVPWSGYTSHLSSVFPFRIPFPGCLSVCQVLLQSVLTSTLIRQFLPFCCAARTGPAGCTQDSIPGMATGFPSPGVFLGFSRSALPICELISYSRRAAWSQFNVDTGGYEAGYQLPAYRNCSVHQCHLSYVWICGFELRKFFFFFFFLGSLELKLLNSASACLGWVVPHHSQKGANGCEHNCCNSHCAPKHDVILLQYSHNYLFLSHMNSY